MRNPLNLGPRVAHGVKGFFAAGEVPVHRNTSAARLAKVNVACELADDQNVQARHQLGLQARSIGELLVANGRAEVGKEAHVFAQAQNSLLWAQWAVQRVVFPVAHRAKQHGVRVHGELERGRWQRVAVGLKSCAAHKGGFQRQVQAQNLQDLDGLGHDFGANAVAGKYCDFHKK